LGNRAVFAAHQGQNLARKLPTHSQIGGRTQYFQAFKDSDDAALCKI
jgi:hypothetical protein